MINLSYINIIEKPLIFGEFNKIRLRNKITVFQTLIQIHIDRHIFDSPKSGFNSNKFAKNLGFFQHFSNKFI
jgi:hypothetical protein